MNQEQFSSFCNRKICLRKTMITNNCTKEWKQKACNKIYSKKTEQKIEKDEKWIKVVARLHEKYNGEDQFWKCLTIDERAHIIQNFSSEWNYPPLQILDPAHILPKSTHPELYYELSNLVLIRRYAHTLLEQFKDPVTRKQIGQELRVKWYERLRGKKVDFTRRNQTSSRDIRTNDVFCSRELFWIYL